MSKKTKPLAVPTHAVGDDVWFAWVGHRRPFTAETLSIKVKAVGPLQTTLEDYPPYESNEGSHARNRLRGKNFETGTRHPTSKAEAIQLLREALARDKQDLIDTLNDLDQKIAAVGEP